MVLKARVRKIRSEKADCVSTKHSLFQLGEKVRSLRDQSFAALAGRKCVAGPIELRAEKGHVIVHLNSPLLYRPICR